MVGSNQSYIQRQYTLLVKIPPEQLFFSMKKEMFKFIVLPSLISV